VQLCVQGLSVSAFFHARVLPISQRWKVQRQRRDGSSTSRAGCEFTPASLACVSSLVCRGRVSLHAFLLECFCNITPARVCGVADHMNRLCWYRSSSRLASVLPYCVEGLTAGCATSMQNPAKTQRAVWCCWHMPCHVCMSAGSAAAAHCGHFEYASYGVQLSFACC
jgi:hypothetical protein